MRRVISSMKSIICCTIIRRLLCLCFYTLRARYAAYMARALVQNYPGFAVSLEVNKKLVQQVIIVFLPPYLSLCLFLIRVFFVLQFFFFAHFFYYYLKFARTTKTNKDDRDV
jgi:hypothetical protein